MFSSLWKSSSAEEKERINRYSEQLRQLVTHYPIGEKIHYYPEYLDRVSLETMILGYEINEKQIYARDHVHLVNDDAVEFFLEGSGDTLTAADLASFALIVPDTSDLEKTLDYNSRALLGRSGQFVRGNSITLVAAASKTGTPILDTTVIRRSQVKQGYYQDYNIVTLDPRLDSLKMKDHRQENRMALSLSCTLFSPLDGEFGQGCTLLDCSESYVRIEVPQVQLKELELTEGMPVRLHLPMPIIDRAFDLKGEVFAIRTEGKVVLKLKGVRKADKFEDLQLMDRLDLRACLVQCSHKMPNSDSVDPTT